VAGTSTTSIQSIQSIQFYKLWPQGKDESLCGPFHPCYFVQLIHRKLITILPLHDPLVVLAFAIQVKVWNRERLGIYPVVCNHIQTRLTGQSVQQHSQTVISVGVLKQTGIVPILGTEIVVVVCPFAQHIKTMKLVLAVNLCKVGIVSEAWSICQI
jgi:hypothetical protein